MGVSERVMRAGWIDVRLQRKVPLSIRQLIEANPFGQIIVTPGRFQSFDPNLDIRKASRFTGILQRWEYGPDAFTISGPGQQSLVAEDNGIAPPYINDAARTNATLRSWLVGTSLAPGLIPPTVSVGNVESLTATLTWQWHRADMSRRDALEFVTAQLGAEWRVDPQLNFHAGTVDYLYGEPDAIITQRLADHNPSPTLKSFKAPAMTTIVDYTEWTTDVVVLDTSGGAGVARSSASADETFLDGLGNPVSRARYVGVPSGYEVATDLPEIDTWVEAQLAGYRVVHRVTTPGSSAPIAAYDLGGKATDLVCGQWVHVFDPDQGLVDDSVEKIVAGHTIHPITIRLIALEWRLESGMGVYFRTGAGAYTDLSPYVLWEDK